MEQETEKRIDKNSSKVERLEIKRRLANLEDRIRKLEDGEEVLSEDKTPQRTRQILHG